VAPSRRCIACRRPAAKASLLRFVVSHGVVSVDSLARSPGRGAYLCGRPDCTEAALRHDGAALRRALRVEGEQVRVDGAMVRSACEGHAADVLAQQGNEGDRPPAAGDRGGESAQQE
jgi:predicted RNA-binding protein YlxR (DUF448 family)